MSILSQTLPLPSIRSFQKGKTFPQKPHTAPRRYIRLNEQQHPQLSFSWTKQHSSFALNHPFTVLECLRNSSGTKSIYCRYCLISPFQVHPLSSVWYTTFEETTAWLKLRVDRFFLSELTLLGSALFLYDISASFLLEWSLRVFYQLNFARLLGTIQKDFIHRSISIIPYLGVSKPRPITAAHRGAATQGIHSVAREFRVIYESSSWVLLMLKFL